MEQIIRRFSILTPPSAFPFLFSSITPHEYCIDSGRCSEEITSSNKSPGGEGSTTVGGSGGRGSYNFNCFWLFKSSENVAVRVRVSGLRRKPERKLRLEKEKADMIG
ncbi:hypothetical protein CDAR_537711 [Caerostris darwini]|uniref:Uncharacterized protein n=1 Tax=Caerostris darwini TaxID=1538125 RepID=A0AAV4W382_9ARAC|nr:hypothetical protein CDAR_537711 [Caerostris darwini]